MDLFVVDVAGDNTPLEDRECPSVPAMRRPSRRNETQTQQPSSGESSDDDEEDDEDDDSHDFKAFPSAFATLDISNLIPKPAQKPRDPIDVAVETFCRMITTDALEPSDDLAKTNVAKELKSSDIHNIELEQSLPNPSEKNKAKLRKLEASKTKGKKWFNIPATELTDEVQRDLEVIQMRSVLDPKHFYKKNDLKALPKYFQVGKVLPSPLDHYNERGEKKNKKKTIVDELMADAQFQKFNKRKYTEIVEEKKRSGYTKAHSKMKKLKKNK